MKKVLCLALVGGLLCVGSASAATTLTLTLVDDGGGAFHIDGILSGDVSEGLALWSVDVGYDGATCTMDAPIAGNMASFVKDEGLTNPDGYGGTLIGSVLTQVGGAQNTINNDIGNAPYPIGTVVTGVAISSENLAEGTATGGDTITLVADSGFANVIVAGETGPVYEVAAATVDCDVCAITLGGAALTIDDSWKSWANHVGVGDLSVDLSQVGEAGLQTENSEPRILDDHVLTCDFSAVPDIGAATVNAVGINNPGPYAAALSLVGTQLTMIWSPALPDQDTYTITVAGIPGLAGDADVILVALQGNCTNLGASGKVVDALDRLLMGTKFNQVADSTNCWYDITQLGASTGVIDALDKLLLGTKFGNSAP